MGTMTTSFASLFKKRGKGCFCSYILKDDVGLAGCNSVWA
ncbi:hypothetical protein BACPLE_00970 [Phocaeicola plebeius DSM 17135]|uniref:Uncharacterized protein n=1 Tax=Phocaeicola plebeius (strain DSM 17135 / JCM 12973 / CCUG 54634 / M2) TaxID=484018 RepID=B5CW80_PHOPM|nr:hypothetical protein BACPLE_00970 [Phocaeicola plebeius DSM 17135]